MKVYITTILKAKNKLAIISCRGNSDKIGLETGGKALVYVNFKGTAFDDSTEGKHACICRIRGIIWNYSKPCKL